MYPPVPPKVTAVEVAAAQPTEADSAAIAHLSAAARKSIEPVAYLVKVRLKAKLPYTSSGWALYVGKTRIPKYWEYEHGIYFKVLDPQFFADHKGEKLRFTQDEVKFVDTGVKLSQPAAAGIKKARTGASRLPAQADVLK